MKRKCNIWCAKSKKYCFRTTMKQDVSFVHFYEKMFTHVAYSIQHTIIQYMQERRTASHIVCYFQQFWFLTLKIDMDLIQNHKLENFQTVINIYFCQIKSRKTIRNSFSSLHAFGSMANIIALYWNSGNSLIVLSNMFVLFMCFVNLLYIHCLL